jgi:homocysteine S-methyltransferase
MGKLGQRLSRGAALLLDGGFSTHCEAKGADLSAGRLWSARLIVDNPSLVRSVHTDFLSAGSDLVCTASYQGTVRGFVAAGHSPDGARELLRASVALAREATHAFWGSLSPEQRTARAAAPGGGGTGTGTGPGADADPSRAVAVGLPLVAASIGPYGAFLSDGSEYTGRYGLAATPAADACGDGGTDTTMSEDDLVSFHREQVEVLAGAGADVRHVANACSPPQP